MYHNIFDIFITNKKENNVFNLKDIQKIQNISSSFKKIKEYDLKIYKYNNLTLSFDDNNNKNCLNVEYVNYETIKNALVIESKIKHVNIFMFPFINEYNEIVNQHTIEYDQGINVITETNLSSKETIIFIRLKNKQLINKILQIIE